LNLTYEKLRQNLGIFENWPRGLKWTSWDWILSATPRW